MSRLVQTELLDKLTENDGEKKKTCMGLAVRLYASEFHGQAAELACVLFGLCVLLWESTSLIFQSLLPFYELSRLYIIPQTI
jgi:hypothetical protein